MTNQVTIDLYNTLYYISMAIAVVGLIVSVFLFFYLEILDVFMVHTGRGSRKKQKPGKTVSEADNSTSERERHNTAKTKRQRRENPIRKQERERANSRGAIPDMPVQPVVQPVNERNIPETNVLNVAETNVLSVAETNVLNVGETHMMHARETDILANNHRTAPEAAMTAPLVRPEPMSRPTQVRAAGFVLTEEVIFIHTDEII